MQFRSREKRVVMVRDGESRHSLSDQKKKRKGCWHTARKIWSLRILFTVFMLASFLSSGILWFVAYMFWQVSSGHLAEKIHHGNMDAAEAGIYNYLKDGPRALRELTIRLSTNPSFLSVPDSHNLLIDEFFRVVDTRDFSVAYLGTSFGEFAGVEFTLDSSGNEYPQSLLVIVSDRPVANHSLNVIEFRPLNPETGATLYKKDFEVPFDPRNRSWYQVSQDKTNTTLTWCPTFLSKSSTPRLGTVLSTPIRNSSSPDNELIGVVGVHYYFSVISESLRDMGLDTDEIMFMVDVDEGSLMASSHGKVYHRRSVWDDSKNDYVNVSSKITPAEHEDERVVRAAEYLCEMYGGWDRVPKITKPLTHYRDLISVTHLEDGYGLNAVLVDVNPVTNIYGELETANYAFFGVSAGVVLLSILLAIGFGTLITRPITQATTDILSIAKLQLDDWTEHGRKTNQSSSDQFCRTVNFSLHEFSEMEESLFKLRQGLVNFSKFLPGDVVFDVLRKSKEVGLEVRSELCTVMFVDIQDFTTFAERCPPEILVELLCEFFQTTTAMVENFEGTVDKFIGDCVMVLFNAPNTVVQHQLKAVNCALSLLNSQLEKEKSKTPLSPRSYSPVSPTSPREDSSWRELLAQYPSFRFRIGITSGDVLVGFVGSQERVSYTALGDTVNLSSRLQTIAKQYDARLLIGSRMNDEVEGVILTRWLDKVRVKGRRAAEDVFEVIGPKSSSTKEDVELVAVFDHARELYSEGMLGDLESYLTEDLLMAYPNSVAGMMLLRKVRQERKESPSSIDAITEIQNEVRERASSLKVKRALVATIVQHVGEERDD